LAPIRGRTHVRLQCVLRYVKNAKRLNMFMVTWSRQRGEFRTCSDGLFCTNRQAARWRLWFFVSSSLYFFIYFLIFICFQFIRPLYFFVLCWVLCLFLCWLFISFSCFFVSFLPIFYVLPHFPSLFNFFLSLYLPWYIYSLICVHFLSFFLISFYFILAVSEGL